MNSPPKTLFRVFQGLMRRHKYFMNLWFFETKSLICSSTWVEAAPIKFYFDEIFFWNNFSELFRKWRRLMWSCQSFLERFETYAHLPILKSRDLGSIEYIVRKSETYLWWFPQQPWFTFSRLEMSRSWVVHKNLLQILFNIQRWDPGGIKIYGSLFPPNIPHTWTFFSLRSTAAFLTTS